MTLSKVCTPIEHHFNCCCSMIHRFFESQISHKSTGGMSTQYDIHYFRFAIKREVFVTNSSLNRLVTDYLIIILYYTAYLFVRITTYTLYNTGTCRQFRKITFMADRFVGCHCAICPALSIQANSFPFLFGFYIRLVCDLLRR